MVVNKLNKSCIFEYNLKLNIMKILFEIKKGSGDRNYNQSLNIQSYWMIKGKRINNPIITTRTLPSGIVNSIIKEYNENKELTGINLRNFIFCISRKNISIEILNNQMEII
jgi:hypothetical protein